MSEMKLIMESWRGFVNEDEDFEACPVPTVDVDTFLSGLELAMMEPEAQKDYIEKLKGSRTRVKNLNRIIEIGGFLTGLVAVGTGGTALIGAGFVAIVANLWRSRQETQSDKKTNAIMKMLCIDGALLDTIDNDVETLYWTNSGLRDEIEAYIATARASQSPDPMPNFTAHLVNWLNTNDDSPYKVAGQTGPDTDIVAR
tara:strand:+ start:325 stop:921 length:597 start_codon:yes stop_codon:yes gene_type:complete